ncbi:DRTGG domain-containing protein [Pseudogracilibacillus auburnensis]|uniref:Putative transcriptional regulator n=1 Tax=Pseudogracilibacillus auburnensis TaxID=1494959 RepID=A0A2V3VUF8_9BACI|nr:DRTGG domain-containing protein [Pseudogracilibacillus auburnensis]MBO1003386.1 CBS domain-containing protein [Pseudogracilibacillus auburnensis]PXW85310.1 putative transcriptional regulator [Pseudogracilibacillus auburnensis]
MATKHEQIIRHIMSLDVGHKISVRQIAKELSVSDGTAYRAIKEAENQGLVSTIERVGTIRIERKEKEHFKRLTFAEVINVVDGQVLGGRGGLHKTLNKFVIGAMQLEAMMRYTDADSLLIVGNRVKAHELAIKAGAAVLITGGFDTNEHIKKLADDKNLPIMSTSYDTFTVAEMINRAIYDQMIKKEIVFVSDIYTPYDEVHHLYNSDTVEDWYKLNELTSHTRFPVIDDASKVSGMVTSKDVVGIPGETLIEKVMTKNPFAVQAKTSLAYVAHLMVWEGIEVVPVVDPSHELEGLVSRQDVLKALNEMQRQPQVGETIHDVISRGLEAIDGEPTVFETDVTPQMTNQLGTLSNGVLTTLVTEASARLLLHLKKGNMVVESLNIYFIEPVQMDSHLIIKPELLDAGRLYAKINIEIFNGRKLVCKGMLMAQLMDR